MYTVPKDTQISDGKDTEKVVQDAINYNETLRERYNKLERYYLGKHPIISRYKTDFNFNNKLVINHAKYITDINIGYLLGNPVDYNTNEEYNFDLIREEYDKQNIPVLDHEIAKDLSIFGTQFELVYTDQNEIRSTDVDVRNCIMVYDDTISHKPLFAVTYEKSKTSADLYDSVTVYDNNFIYNFVSKGKIKLKSVTPHYFKTVPVIDYINNTERTGDYEPVLSLVDAYNLIQSDAVNDKEQLVDALMVIKGMTLTPEQRYMMKTSRIMAGLDENTSVEYLTKQINQADLDILRQVLEADIHKISMTPNLSDENFVGNASGVAIRYKLLAFEQSILNKERYFERGLMQRFQLYNNYLNKLKGMPIIPLHKVDAIFKRNLPQNDLETAQVVNNLDGIVKREVLVSQLSFIEDVDEAMEEKEEPVNFGTFDPNLISKEEKDVSGNL